MNRRSVGVRLSGLLVLVFTVLVGLSVTNLLQHHDELVESRKATLKQLVDSAVGAARGYYDLARSGQITEEAAKERALSAIRGMRYSDDNYFWINDNSPRMIMHAANPKLDGQSLADIKDSNGKRLFQAFVQITRRDGAGYVEYTWPRPGDKEPVNKLSYVEAFQPWGWIVGTGIYTDDLETAFLSSMWDMAWKAGVVLLIIGVLGGLLVRSIVRPLRDTVAEAEKLAGGDTAVEFSAALRNDEIGAAARAVAAFRDRIAEQQVMVEQTMQAQEQRAARQQRIEDLIAGFRAKVGERLATVRTNTDGMRDTARDLTSIAEQTTGSVETASAASEQAVANIQAGASATRQMAASISEISAQIAKTSQVVAETTEATERSNDKVASLAHAASKIGEVIGLIQDIAEQTNLLALNATIEAARAGEMGKGFAVVAAEVKDLATQTSRATEEIGSQIAGIQGSTTEAVEAIRDISGKISDVNEFTAIVAAAIEEQSSATEEISRSVEMAVQDTHRASNGIAGVSDACGRTERSASSVLAASDEVAAYTGQLNEEIDGFLKAVAEA